MKLKEIMTRDVEVVAPRSPIKEAAEKMKSLDVGLMPVCDGNRLTGMLTDRDITVRAVSEGRDPNTTKVEDVMTPEVVFAFEDSDVSEAAEMMERHQIRRLIILDRQKQMAGVVSLGDVAFKAKDKDLTAEVTQRVSDPAQPER